MTFLISSDFSLGWCTFVDVGGAGEPRRHLYRPNAVYGGYNSNVKSWARNYQHAIDITWYVKSLYQEIHVIIFVRIQKAAGAETERSSGKEVDIEFQRYYLEIENDCVTLISNMDSLSGMFCRDLAPTGRTTPPLFTCWLSGLSNAPAGALVDNDHPKLFRK